MKVLKITENKDGSATINYEITKAEKELIKRVYKRKRFTPALLRRILIDAVNKRMVTNE